MADRVEENATGGNEPVDITSEQLWDFVRKIAQHSVQESLAGIDQRISDLEAVIARESNMKAATTQEVPATYGATPDEPPNYIDQSDADDWYRP